MPYNCKDTKNDKYSKNDNSSISAHPPGYNQAIAEMSQDNILARLRGSVNDLENVLINTIYEAAINIAINYAIVMILLFVVVLIILIYTNVITGYQAGFGLALWIIFVAILAIIYVAYVYTYSVKRIRITGEIFNNFIASEDLLKIINDSAGAYRKVTGR